MPVKTPRSAVSWADVRPWVRQLEDYGYRVRLVLGLEPGQRLRVSFTLSRRNDEGRHVEALRDGDLVGDASPDAPQKAAIRAAARLLGRLEAEAHGPGIPPPYYEQLPLWPNSPDRGE